MQPYNGLAGGLQMAELGLVEYFAIAEAVGIIATFFIVTYYSRKGLQTIKTDIETNVLNDLDEKLHGAAEAMMQNPKLVKLFNRSGNADASEELVFAYYVLYMCAHAFHMRQRNVLSDNEWEGWLRWMRSTFEFGSLGDYWGKTIDPKGWFDPAFEDFINNEIIKKAK
jgi:hypothetical protein